jgi:MYXO-CTERM domain-containing protein
VGGGISDRNRRGLHTWFLDMNPATTDLDGLAAGGTFADPTGSPKITVVSLDATQATIKVEFDGGGTGAPTCLDDTPLQGMGPGPASCAAMPAAPSGTPPVVPDGGAAPIPSAPARRDAGGAARPDAAAGSVEGDAGANLPPPPGGAGSGGAGAGTPAGAVPIRSGCGCRVGGAEPARASGALVAVLLGLALLIRRRRHA